MTPDAAIAAEITPGCFGSALAHDPNLNECKTCPLVQQCGSRAREAADKLFAALGGTKVDEWRLERARKMFAGRPKVEAPMVDAPKAETAPEPKAEIIPPTPRPVRAEGELPKKAGELVEKIRKSGIDILAELSKGVNPYASKTPAYMRLTCDLIIAGGFNKPYLKGELIKAFAWGDGTAGAHVSFIVPALLHLNVIEPGPVAGGYILKRS